MDNQKEANPDRVMSLVVSRFDFDDSGKPTRMLKKQVKTEIQQFWDGKTTEPHKLVNIAAL